MSIPDAPSDVCAVLDTCFQIPDFVYDPQVFNAVKPKRDNFM